MADPRMMKWAKALAGYSVEIQPGQVVAISGGSAAEPLLREIYREVVERGAHPVMVPSVRGGAPTLLGKGSDAQLEFISPVERFVREQADVVINVMAETNTRSMSQVDPARQAIYQRARRELFERFMERAGSGEMDWTLTLFPTSVSQPPSRNGAISGPNRSTGPAGSPITRRTSSRCNSGTTASG